MIKTKHIQHNYYKIYNIIWIRNLALDIQNRSNAVINQKSTSCGIWQELQEGIKSEARF